MINTKRGADWAQFANRVKTHIEVYTVPQYGDAPNDQVETWTAADCIRQITRYAARFGKNQRPDQDLLDLMKIAHYAQLAHDKLQKGTENE